MNLQWMSLVGNCPVEHYHLSDPTCMPGGSGNEPGAQNGPHRHESSATCQKERCCGRKPPPGACVRPHHHVNDPSWRPA
jgi:hypothetical protein